METAVVYWLGSGAPEGGNGEAAPARYLPSQREELLYRIELWDEAKSAIEQVLAVTANGSIGFAAYYAATREFPNRYVTLRHKDRVISRWNGPGQ